VEKGTTPNTAWRTAIAVDVAQSVLEVTVSTRPGRVSARHRLQRKEVLPFFAQQPAATVLLEACGSTPGRRRERTRAAPGEALRLVPGIEAGHGPRGVCQEREPRPGSGRRKMG
jgi:hypothetical protein